VRGDCHVPRLCSVLLLGKEEGDNAAAAAAAAAAVLLYCSATKVATILPSWCEDAKDGISFGTKIELPDFEECEEF
jgi:hypothetical protein